MAGLRSLLDKLRSSRWYVVSLGNLSITWRLTISLVLAMLVFSVIGISVSYLIGRQQILNKVEQQADERVAMLATTLGIPLWNFAYDEVEHIAQAHVADVLVSGVTIVDLSGTVVFSAGEEYETATVSRVSKIYHKGQEIGYVEMTLAADYPMELNQQFLLLTSLVVLINLACLVVAIMFLMPRLIRRPIERIIEIANRYGSGKYDVSQKEVTAAEFRPVISALGTMANEIQSQVLELQRSEENFRHSLDNSPLGIRIITTEGELLYANQAVLDIYGYSSVEELKATPTKQHYTPKSYAEHQMRKAKRKKGEPVLADYEISIVRKDGEVRHLAVFRKEVIWSGEMRFQALCQDITKRKRVEMALRQSEEFNSSLLTNSPGPILVLNADASIRYVNPAVEKLTGFSSAELVGSKPPYPWWIEKTPGELSRRLVQAMHLGTRKYESLYRKKNGERFWVEKIFKIVKMKGEFKYYLINWVDLTEQRRLKANMEFYLSQVTRAQEEERKRIAREIHDESIQSLATLALGIDAIAREKKRLPEDVILRLKGLRAETDSISDGLRRFSHELRPGVIDQVGLVPALEILTEELNKENRVKTSLEVAGSEQRLIPETELALFRIAQEALRNVKKHSSATKAAIRLKFTRSKVKLTVSDDGRGFELPGTLSDFAADGKLGLIGMQERIRLLGGKLLVRSWVGRGTTVVVEMADVQGMKG